MFIHFEKLDVFRPSKDRGVRNTSPDSADKMRFSGLLAERKNSMAKDRADKEAPPSHGGENSQSDNGQSAVDASGVTTLALGEEAGNINPAVMTLALGEEGIDRSIPSTLRTRDESTRK